VQYSNILAILELAHDLKLESYNIE